MLVIFDCDGVLVDSEKLAAEVFSAELAQLGLALPADECFAQFHGRTLTACFARVEERFGCSLPENFAETIHRATRRTFAKDLKPVPGVQKVLTHLQEKGVSFCVASNGGNAKIEHSLGVTGLLPFFEERRFSAEMVPQGKPAPDLFLLAARSFGVAPSACVVVEDSRVGLRAAEAAGMTALLFSVAAAPDGVKTSFSSMSELPLLLDRILFGGS